MPLNARNTRTLDTCLLANRRETVRLLKRMDDQLQGQVTEHKLFRCWWDPTFSKSGQALLGDMATGHRRSIYVPRTELDRVGVNYLNVLDRFVDSRGWVWQPETHQTLTEELFGNYVRVELIRLE